MTDHACQLSIGIVSYRRVDKLRVLIASLMAQDNLNFEVNVMHDGLDAETKSLVSYHAEIAPFKISYSESTQRYNDFGHSLREDLIKKCSSDYLLLTNDDNYYTPNFVSEMMSAIENEKLDLAYCDMVHSHVFKDTDAPYSYQTLITEPKRGKIDIGCFIVKTEIAKSVGFADKSWDGDATYFEGCIKYKPGIAVGKVKKVLFVHN